MNICKDQIDAINQTNDCIKIKHTYIKRIVVQGKAGSRKSTLIHKIYQTVCKSLGSEAIIITAPTGAAAVNINGNTIHSKFKLPFNASAFKVSKDEALRQF